MITPKNLRFKIKSGLAYESIYEGMIIDYDVTPLFGIKVNWRAEIVQVLHEKSFTDVQVKGPYKLWRHFHEFIANREGVLVKDTVEYELPFGEFGNLVHALFVRKRVNDIFEYRYRVLDKLFH